MVGKHPATIHCLTVSLLTEATNCDREGKYQNHANVSLYLSV